MLQNMRDNSRGIIAYILIGILVIFFALSGVEALFNWSADKGVAEVNGQKISTSALDSAIENRKQQIQNMYGNQVPAEYLTNEILRQPALDNLIRRELLLQYAKKSSMTISAVELSQQIMSEPNLKDEKGNFDSQRYQQFLSMNRLTHNEYLRVLGDGLMLDQLQQSLSASEFTLAHELDAAVNLGFQTRDFSYFQIPMSQVVDSIVIPEADINAEYQANPAKYTADEQLSVDYIELNIEDLMAKVQITEEQIRKQYELSSASFVATPERQAAHILIEGDKPDLVKLVSEKIAAGEDFSELAKTYSDDLGTKEQGGDLGYTTGDLFPKEFEDALAKLTLGQVSGVVRTDAGIHFIKLLNERGISAPSFEEQRALIEDQLKRVDAENMFLTQLEKLKEDTYNAETLADVAPALGLEVKNTGLFSRATAKGIAANPKFIEAAFSADVLQEGNSSEPVELESMHVVVLKKTEHKPAYLKPLAEVQGDIVNELKNKRSSELLVQKGQEFIQQIQNGVSIIDLAKAQGYELKEAKAVPRQTAEIDSSIVRYAFAMAKPSENQISVSGTTLPSGDYAVITLLAATKGDLTGLPAEQQTALVAQLSQMKGDKTLQTFQKLLEAEAEIERF